jgi:hypothetical protein
MVRPFALALKCYSGFVLIADTPRRAPTGEYRRLWPLTSNCAAISHGSTLAFCSLRNALARDLGADDHIDAMFPSLSTRLTQECGQLQLHDPCGLIVAGFDNERKPKFLGWYWDGTQASEQVFDLVVVHGVPNPIAAYLLFKLYSFDLSESSLLDLASYVALLTRAMLPFPMDEFLELGVLSPSNGLLTKSVDEVNSRLEFVKGQNQKLKLDCEGLFCEVRE